MRHVYDIRQSRDKLSRGPVWCIVRDSTELPMQFCEHALAAEFLKALQEDDEKKDARTKRFAA